MRTLDKKEDMLSLCPPFIIIVSIHVIITVNNLLTIVNLPIFVNECKSHKGGKCI